MSNKNTLGVEETFAALPISSYHLTEQDRFFLDAAHRGDAGAWLTVAEYTGGWWVFVPRRSIQDSPTPQKCLSEHFWRVMDIAREVGCRWVQFDYNHPFTEGLTVFQEDP